ncbi:flagellar filament protein FlaA [Spirochaetia bacterium]|nr:flagellar filament protein FlaA [Spirochaetia bacterium]
MKRYVVIALMLSLAGFTFAQEEIGGTDAERIGVDSAQQKLKEVSVERFEQDGFWRSHMSPDEGYTTTRLFEGSPQAKKAIPDEADLNIPDRYVLGTRVDYLRRGHSSFVMYPMRPIPIEGVTKTISVWAAGRNFNHELYIQIQDFFGRPFELYVGNLNFQGWKQLTVAIPPQAADGRNGIIQRNYHYNNQMGIKVVGFKVKVDPVEAFGSYYLYLDDVRAVTDLFAEESRDPDDMIDAW